MNIVNSFTILRQCIKLKTLRPHLTSKVREKQEEN